MKRAVSILCCILCLLLPLAALAADTFQTGERGDAVLRAQIRLYDLGYTLLPPTGVWRSSDTTALSAFAIKNAPTGADALFLSDAQPAYDVSAADAQSGSSAYGGLMPWSEAKTRLVAGQSYTVTDDRSGIILHLQYLGGEGYAVLRPALAWDNATMEGLFSEPLSMEARPAVISIDGMLAAAALRLDPFANDSTGFSHVKLYFSGSFSPVGGLPDADCDAAVQLAARKG